MAIKRRSSVCAYVLALDLFLALASVASEQEHWVGTWAASPQAVAAPTGRPAPRPGAAPAPANLPPRSFNDQTIRMVVPTTIGGHRARVQISNAFGTAPLKVGAVHVALQDKELHDKQSAIVSGSDHPLTFSGGASFTIPPGAEIISDPVDLDVPKLGDLVISVYLPGEVTSLTDHATGLHTTYIASGDLTAAASIPDAKKSESWYFISGVDIDAPARAAAVVAFGDSITDGATSTPDTDSGWPSQLARRLLSNKATQNVAVINEGISGNRLLSDGAGISALARFDRDVLAQPGVKWLIIMEGINDIGFSVLQPNTPAVTADELIAAQKQMIDRAHMRGIKVVGATLTPYTGAFYYSDKGEQMREAVNQWIRTGKAYDAVLDFDKVVADPENPKQIRPTFNIRDHLHPNDAGYKAMADSIDLAIFKK